MPTPAEEQVPARPTGGEPPADANGPAAAAVLAAGIGCAVLGLAVVLVEASEGVRAALTWCPSAGSLTGETSLGTGAWLVSWAVLHARWRSKDVSFDRVWTAALFLVGLSFLMTFPPFFGLFGP